MRLIDADADKCRPYLYEYLTDMGMIAAQDAINAMPSIDAVQVVRCRVCAHCDDKTPYELWCLGRGWPNQMVPPDGYCDKGKRREAAR